MNTSTTLAIIGLLLWGIASEWRIVMLTKCVKEITDILEIMNGVEVKQ